MGPAEFTPEVFARLLKSGVRLVQWGGPHPRQPDAAHLVAEVQATVAQFGSHGDLFRLVRRRQDLADLEITRSVYVVLTVQNPGAIGEAWSRLDELWDAGVRVIQLAYWDCERYGCGFLAPEDTGLTLAGQEFLRQIAARGFILDLSHAGPRTALEAAQAYQGRLMISHTGSRTVYDYPRNAPDQVIRLVGARDGIVGVYTMTFFLNGADNSISPWLIHVQYVADLVGADHVAIGSDAPVAGCPDVEATRAGFLRLAKALDATGRLQGVLAPRWPAFIPELNGTDRFAVLAEALRPYFSHRQRQGIVGQNALRFYRSALPQE
ncbi:MAG: membrane dipeptidase [Candidatus Magasanikbacteria bacterium]|nr:membrane dipeptidase [Candidatus Magasanikbacteria bacterium]